ncbi:LysR substrate-binding domain-containing protein [Erythrobacter sp.]|uniref:LysR substrate-binding domain-containing protein n=1 Tax=Erythrobacter sp. TaxID=1042 RepID=UPI003120424D
MSRLPPLAAIRAFEAAGRHENFSRAAEELGMTQAAISYQIRQLEDRVGTPLFVRTKGRVELSDTGRRLLPAVSGGLSTIADAFAALAEDEQDVLAIDAPLAAGATWLSARIGRFQLRHPDLAVKLTLSNDLVEFGLGKVDVTIRVGLGKWEGMRSDFLFRQHFTPICSPEFVEANDIRRPEDLLRVERHTPNDPMWAGWFAKAGIGETPPPRRGIVLDGQLQEANAALAGYGIALLSPLYWRADLESGRLVQPFETLYLPGASQWVVHPASRVGVRKIERFREWVQREFEAERDGPLREIWERPE